LKYHEFIEKTSYSHTELIACSHGHLIEDPPHDDMVGLPAPPFLMFDRVTLLERGRRGRIVAEQDIRSDAWYFQCHFRGDPVQPGCLGVDAVWQLIGFYCTASGAIGSGRALGAGRIEFLGQIRPFDKVVTYDVDIRRYSKLDASGSTFCVANGKVSVDGQEIYTIEDAKVGIFKGIAYRDYPNPLSPMARGGIMARG
jgi:3-hydroxyacyl-[acyl-carrier protein] dehydratase / trans-2-decenoyl-[acyl-carrier protein] isomerase